MLRKQVILYRYWYYNDADIYKSLKHKIAVTQDDLKYIDIDANIDDFAQTTTFRLAKLKHTIMIAGDHRRCYEHRRDYLIYLHADYMNRLNETGDYDQEGIVEASENWTRTTLDVMEAVFRTLKEQPLPPKKGKPYVIDADKAFGDLLAYLDRELWKNHEDFSRRFLEMAVIDDDTPRNYPRTKPLAHAKAGKEQEIQAPSKTNEFRRLVRNKEKIDSVMSYLHSHIDELTGVEAFIYIQAAIDGKILDRPPYKAAHTEFPNIGKRANYDAYVGFRVKFNKRKDTLETIQAELQAL